SSRDSWYDRSAREPEISAGVRCDGGAGAITSAVLTPGTMMRPRLLLALAALPFAGSSTMPTPTLSPGSPPPAPATPIVIRADRMLDGKGGTIVGGSVVVDGERITKVDRTAPAA